MQAIPKRESDFDWLESQNLWVAAFAQDAVRLTFSEALFGLATLNPGNSEKRQGLGQIGENRAVMTARLERTGKI